MFLCFMRDTPLCMKGKMGEWLIFFPCNSMLVVAIAGLALADFRWVNSRCVPLLLLTDFTEA